MRRPNRSQLLGYSRSKFKTLLRRKGHQVPRDFYKYVTTTIKNGRYWRWRWWSEEGFVVDMSCLIADFDRWANSVDKQFDARWLIGSDK